MRIATLSLLAQLAVFPSSVIAQTVAPSDLRPPSAFDKLADSDQRSRAIFTEIGKVLTHPRCMNCHPAGDQPLQGADHRIHFPPASRAGLGDSCAACHTNRNVTLHVAASFQSVPGHPRWALAPLSMAWEGKSLGEICRQIKDTDRNGGRDLALLHEHIAKDDLVAWGWKPGASREPAPGSQDIAGQLTKAWIDSGAECP